MSVERLRGQTIEAMAKANCEARNARIWPCIAHRQEATTGLDAALVFLSENAEVWRQAAYEKFPETDPDVFGAAAVAVLRDAQQ